MTYIVAHTLKNQKKKKKKKKDPSDERKNVREMPLATLLKMLLW